MIDQDRLDRLKPACARILRKSDRMPFGTGYLVAKGFVATCYHVVSTVLHEPLVCRFGDVEVWEREARVLRWDTPRDTALLEIDGPDAAEPIPAEPADPKPSEWYAYGFPLFAELLGVPLLGQTLDVHTADKDGRPALCLSVHQFASELPASVGGLSGTPVVAGRRLLGQFFRVLGAEDGWQKPHFGLCYATPAWAVAGLVAASGHGEVGAQVRPPQVMPPPAPTTPDEIAERMRRYESGAEVLASLRNAGNPGEVRQALARWEAAGLPPEQGVLLAGEALVGMAAADDALQVLAPVSDTARGRQLSALALSVRGENPRAQALLQQLPVTEETAGINGGILKRRWLREGKRAWLLASHDAYQTQNKRAPSAYLAVNVAALGLQLGDERECREEATRARDLILAKPEAARTHWDWASLGEAELLLGDLDSARLHYRRATARAAGNARDIAVMRRQARLDLEKLGRPRGALDDALPVGGVACVVGAPLDEAAWTAARRAELRGRIATLLRDRQVIFGFGSAARGGDLLFAESILEIGSTPGVFLPLPPAPFETTWVGPLWQDSFRRIPPERLQVVTPVSADRPFSGSDREAMAAAVEMGKRLDETPLLVACPPPPGGPDTRRVREAMDAWQARSVGDVVELSMV